MHASVIGCGYLGAVHAAAMASLGHRVIGIDSDRARIDSLSRGVAPFFEPGLEELLQAGLATGRLSFSSDVSDAAGADMHFVCVGTPTGADGVADLTWVEAAVDALLPHLLRGAIVVGKSTVPVGTAARLSPRVSARGGTLAWNPEFLREGTAVQDTLAPDRIVIGVETGDAGEQAATVLTKFYDPTGSSSTPYVITDLATAELAKGAANAFLAMKVSFMNAMADLADASGADVADLAAVLGHDPRIGHRYLGAGIGFGGGCLPKDLHAFVSRAEQLGQDTQMAILREVDAINRSRIAQATATLRAALGGSVLGRRIAVLGAAFKPDSDDVRDSPALAIALELRAQGAHVVVTDPAALDTARTKHPELSFAANWRDAAMSADALFIATEWQQYRDIDPTEATSLVTSRLVFDGRNCLDRAKWRAAGWQYIGVGRR
ncbi:UDP-glucose dehydrogenase family protein [Leucobacter sp. HY1910]